MDVSEFEEQLRAEAHMREQERMWEDEHDEEMELLRELEDGPPAKRALVSEAPTSTILPIPKPNSPSRTMASTKSGAPSKIRKTINPFDSDSSDEDTEPQNAPVSSRARPGKRARYLSAERNPTRNTR